MKRYTPFEGVYSNKQNGTIISSLIEGTKAGKREPRKGNLGSPSTLENGKAVDMC